MRKKIISAVLVLGIIISSIAISIPAFASSQVLYLDMATSANTSGSDDLEWFYYTPTESGMYSLLSYNVPKCEAYLFVKEVDPETGAKQYVQLAYAGPSSDPDYTANGHNEFQFKLTYHLEAGVTYYYACGWYLSNRTSGSFTVKLVCDSYDSNSIESIELSNPPTLNGYTDGEWRVGPDNKDYYHYNLNKVISNLTVTLNYSNGTSSTAVGKTSIDGYQLKFIDNQYYSHWYPEGDVSYTENPLTVSVLNKSATVNIPIIMGDIYPVKGKVVNLVGQPVEGAKIMIDSATVATSGSDGCFSFNSSSGFKKIEITGDTAISYKSTITLEAGSNDFRESPFAICNCDLNRDGYVNAKDYAKIIKEYSGDEQANLKSEYQVSINFNSYE